MIFLLVPLLVIGTVAWRYRKSQRREFPLIAEKGRTDGIKALDDGNFDKAHQLLAAAASAVDALGGAVEAADEIRHAALEAAVFVNLAPGSLEDMLAEAGRTAPEAWDSKFDLLYKGRSILIDSWITAAPESGGSSGYSLFYRVLPAGEPSNFRAESDAPPERFADLDLAGLELLEQAHPQVGDRVTFGARLASFRYQSDRDRWLVRFEPKSGVFITHLQALQPMGWPPPRAGDEPPEPPP
jgi:hypothetical protein